VCRKRSPLTMRNLQVERLSPGSASFNLDNWTGNGTTRHELSAGSGVLTSSQPGGRIY